MRTSISAAGRHALLACMMLSGLLWTVLSFLQLDTQLPVACLTGAGVILWLSLTLISRRSRLPGIILGCLVLGVSAGLGGAHWPVLSGLRALYAAIVLDQPVALHLYAQETALLLGGLLALFAYAVSSEHAGCIPACLCFAFLCILIWQSPSALPLWPLIPFAASAGIMISAQVTEGTAFRRILPVALVIAALAFCLIPRQGIGIPPLQDAAQALRQKIMDYLFFTEPRNVFSLAQEGYYPDGPAQLGGPAQPDEHPIMQVSAPRTVYLRGAVKNVYTGRAWLDSTGGRRYLWISGRWRELRERLFDESLPIVDTAQYRSGDTGRIQVSMLSDSASTLFVPQRIRELNVGGSLIPYFNLSSELFATHDLSPADQWSVEASLFTGGDPGLEALIRECAASGSPDVYRQVQADYTALPEHLSDTLFALAHEIVADAGNEYQQALALCTHLQQNYRYTLACESVPEGQDFVSYFLLRTREGYCTYFASAMTVLARMAGLPARYVEGFRVTPEASGPVTVTGHDGHAWCEVYFSGFGWLTFDPTPGPGQTLQSTETETSSGNEPAPDAGSAPEATPSPEPSPSPSATPAPSEPTAAPTDTPEPSQSPTPAVSHMPEETQPPESEPHTGTETHARTVWPWLLLLLLICLLALWYGLSRPAVRSRHARTPEDRYRIWLHAVFTVLRILGVPRNDHETLSGYARRLERNPSLPDSLTPFLDSAVRWSYAHQSVQEREIRMGMQVYTDLVHGLHLQDRLRLVSVQMLENLTSVFAHIRKKAA